MYVRDVEDGWNYIVYVILLMSGDVEDIETCSYS